jgi:hypothetical protein
MKFYFRATDISVSMPTVDIAGKLVLVWKRGPRRTTTEPFPVKESLSSVDGSLSRTASTSQELALICTMFKNSRTGTFEPKSASFSLREESAEGQERKLGTASVDLSSYATPEKSSDAVELSLMDGKVRLKLTLTSHWLKTAVASADDDDNSSVGSFASSAIGGGSDDSLGDVETPSPAGARAPATFGRAAVAGAGGASANAAPSMAERAAGAAPPASERERSEKARNAAVEARWAAEEAREAKQEAADALRSELATARDELSQARAEAKALKGRVERLMHENRVLRRDQRGGQRDEVVLQLETELVAKEQERADMEENLSSAFGAVIGDLNGRISQLTTERDGLLIKIEEKSKPKGFLGKS